MKPIVLLTRMDYPTCAVKLLNITFSIKMWDKPGEMPQDELVKNVPGIFGLLCDPKDRINSEVLDAAGPSLKVVSTMSVGYDHLNVTELKARGIRIGNTPDVLTEAVAEMAITLLLATSRRLLESHMAMKRGDWNSQTWTPYWMCGRSLANSTVGIIGVGRIGQSIAEKLKAFKTGKLFYTSRKENENVGKLGGIRMDIDDVMRESDFIVVALALVPETKHIINKERIGLMKQEAIIVNIGRGGLIEQDALVEVLKEKRIRGAGLDVMTPEPLPIDHPLLSLDNAVITPHISSATYEARDAMTTLAAQNILAAYDGTKMPAEI